MLEVPVNLLGDVSLLGQVNKAATTFNSSTVLTNVVITKSQSTISSDTPEEVNRGRGLGVHHVLHDGVASLGVLVQLSDVQVLYLIVQSSLEIESGVVGLPVCLGSLSSTQQRQSFSL